LFITIIEDKGRTCQTIKDRDKFIPHERLLGARSLLMLDSIFLMNSTVIFFLLVSGKEKLSPNCSRHYCSRYISWYRKWRQSDKPFVADRDRKKGRYILEKYVRFYIDVNIRRIGGLRRYLMWGGEGKGIIV